MSMRHFVVSVAVITLGAFVCALSHGYAANRAPAHDAAVAPLNRLTDRDRQRLEEAGPAIVKSFIATLRTRFTDESAAKLRAFIDPRYLKEHGLEDGPLPIGRVVTRDIYDNQISDDPQTLLIVAQTEEAAKEAFVFRTTVYEGSVYLLPLAHPDPKTRSFKPWILRVKL